MMHEQDAPNPSKISPEFATRLTDLEPQQKVRVIVLLQVQNAENSIEKRQSRAERQAAIKAVRESAEQALENIGGIIQRFDGQQLAEHPNLLGSIPVEITAAGVNALAESDAVKAVIEDQAIFSEHLNNSLEADVINLFSRSG
jgi:sorbitol-specific phosphotransferase system component IIA